MSVRRASIATICFVCCLIQTAGAQYYIPEPPDLWMKLVTPTARAWAMGHADNASMEQTPSLACPATLGLWAMRPRVYESHNWESVVTPRVANYRIANDIQAIGFRWTNSIETSWSIPALGFMHREGRYGWNPNPGAVDGWLSGHYDHSFETWAVGLGLDLGIELGVGITYGHERFTLLNPDEVEEEYSMRSYDRGWEWGGGLAARARLGNILRRYDLLDHGLTVSGFEFDGYIAFTAPDPNSSGQASGLMILHDSRPTLSYERLIDRRGHSSTFYYSQDGDRRSGWEVELFGSFAVRRGEWKYSPIYLWYDGHDWDNRTTYDWATEGYAFDLGNAQRWIRTLFDIETSKTLGWILDHVEARYETASFRHPEAAPPGLGDVSVREWTVGLNNIDALWTRSRP